MCLCSPLLIINPVIIEAMITVATNDTALAAKLNVSANTKQIMGINNRSADKNAKAR